MQFKAQRLSILLALFLVVYSLILHVTHNLENKTANYFSIIIYFVGIFVITYKTFKQDTTQSFGTLFSSVIKTAILSTLFMVIWAFVAQYLFPEVKVNYIANLRTQLLNDNVALSDMEKTISNMNKNFTLMYISKNIFMYGMIGAFFTVVSCISIRIMK